MLYFGPKRDYKFVLATFGLEQHYLQTYGQFLSFVALHHLDTFPPDRLSPDEKAQFVGLSERYRAERDAINRLQARMTQVADRYDGPDVTSYFLDTTAPPDYSRNRPSLFNAEDNNVWKDGRQRLIGHIQLAKDEDFKKLCNPLNWIYLPLRSVFRVPMEVLHFSGTAFGKFWEKLAEGLAMLVMLAIVLFVLFWFFGVPSDALREIIIKRLVGGK
jgi:hypothetical protein